MRFSNRATHRTGSIWAAAQALTALCLSASLLTACAPEDLDDEDIVKVDNSDEPTGVYQLWGRVDTGAERLIGGQTPRAFDATPFSIWLDVRDVKVSTDPDCSNLQGLGNQPGGGFQDYMSGALLLDLPATPPAGEYHCVWIKMANEVRWEPIEPNPGCNGLVSQKIYDPGPDEIEIYLSTTGEDAWQGNADPLNPPGSLMTKPYLVTAGTERASFTISLAETIDTGSCEMEAPRFRFTGDERTVGNTGVFGGSSFATNLRSVQYVMPEDGLIDSVVQYHDGGGGLVRFGIYSDGGGWPDALLAETPAWPVEGAAGWQAVELTNFIDVPAGERIWLSWLYSNIPGVRYQSGTPGRYQYNGYVWGADGALPGSWANHSQSSYIYSIYAKYTPTGGPMMPPPPGNTHVQCDTPNMNIIDGATVTDFMNVAQTGAITDVDVSVRLTHTWVSDIDMYVRHPSGAGRWLIQDRCGSSNDMDAIYDDEGTPLVCSAGPAIGGTIQPLSTLDVYDGMAMQGNWSINVRDDAFGDQGVVQEWCVIISYL